MACRVKKMALVVKKCPDGFGYILACHYPLTNYAREVVATKTWRNVA